jgi:hypothetical protein
VWAAGIHSELVAVLRRGSGWGGPQARTVSIRGWGRRGRTVGELGRRSQAAAAAGAAAPAKGATRPGQQAPVPTLVGPRGGAGVVKRPREASEGVAWPRQC